MSTFSDDKDRELARRLGDRLERGASLEGNDAGPEDAAFVHALAAYKRRRERDPQPSEVRDRVWSALDARLTQDRPARPRAVLRLVSRRTWLSLAAAVVVLVGLGWWVLTNGPSPPVLLAEAGADPAVVTLADGSVVTLRPGSRLYGLDAEETRVRLDGEGFFEVTKNEGRTFTVEAGVATVAVLGTRFDVSTWGGRTDVFLEEGRVRFSHEPTGQSVELAPGQQSRILADGTLSAPEEAPGDDYTDWLRGEIVFTSRPLRLVLDELGFQFKVTFDVPDTLAEETVSGRILLTDEAQSISDLGVVLGGRFVKRNETAYRFVAE